MEVRYPAASIQAPSVSTVALSTSASTVVKVPLATSGYKPSFIRLALSVGAAHVRWGSDTSITAVTSDTILTTNEALWISSAGIGAVAFRQATGSAGTAGEVASVTALEEGSLRPTSDTSGLG